jgi:hypothetical protein
MTLKTEFVLSAKDETQAAFNSVNGALSKVSGSSVNLVNSFKNIALAATGLAGVGSLAVFKSQIDSAIAAMGGLKDAAEKTGASVENLSALKGVAKIGDRDFGMIENSIVKLNKALHGTDDESKGAGKALAALGLDLQKLRQMDPAEAFVEIARAQEKFSDGGGKTAALLAIMGKNAAELIPYMHDLAEQQKLVGKVTSEQAKAADEYEKNLKRLTASWGALSRQMAGAVVGPLKDITDWMVNAQKEGGVLAGVFMGIGAAVTKAFGGEINPGKIADKSANEAFAKVADLRKQLGEAESGKQKKGWFGESLGIANIDEIKDQLSVAERELKSSIKRRDKIVKGEVDADKPKDTSLNAKTFGATPKGGGGTSSKAIDPADALLATLDKQIAVRALDLATTEKLTAAEKESAQVMQQLDSGAIKATASQRSLIEGKLQFLVAADKELTKQKEYNDALENASQAMTTHRQKMVESISVAENQAEVYGLTESQLSVVTQARLTDAIAMAQANGASEETIKYLEEELKLRGQLTDALVKVDKKRIEQQGAATDQTNEFAQQAARNIQSSLADFLFDPFADGADKMAQKFGQIIQRMAADAAAAQIGKALFGDMGSGKSGGDSGLVGAGMSALSKVNWAALFSYDGGGSTGTGLRSGGVDGKGGFPAILHPNETVVDHTKGQRVGGNNITINVNSPNGDPAEVRRSAAAGARSALGFMGGARRYA